jgi:hypothetical protein
LLEFSAMCCRLCPLTLLAAASMLSAASPAVAEITAERTEGGVTIKIDGQPFTEYLMCSGTKPILWPIIGPTGKPMTRAYPMGEGTKEKKDHVHHRSLWFTHGDVNGVDFWSEKPDKNAITKHREFVEVKSGPCATVVARNDWLAPDGKKVCEDQRTFTFGTDGDARWIDFDIAIKASEGPVKFGDTKEGSMGIRVAETMKVDAKLGGKIINSEGQTDKDAWGKPAAWVDYYGPVDGETLGIAIFNHPSSLRFPTTWHVRTYGLFAANPFCLRDFTGDKSADGSYTLPAGQTMTLRYRILLHRGDEKSGKVAEAYAAYAKEAK